MNMYIQIHIYRMSNVLLCATDMCYFYWLVNKVALGENPNRDTGRKKAESRRRQQSLEE